MFGNVRLLHAISSEDTWENTPIITPGGALHIFWVRGRAIGKGIDFPHIGISNGIDFYNFDIRNGTNFQDSSVRFKVLVYLIRKIGIKSSIPFPKIGIRNG